MNLSDLSVVGSLGALTVSALALLRGSSKESETRAQEITDLKARVVTLERETKDMNAVLVQVRNEVAAIPALNGKLDGLDRLVTYRLDELGSQLRQVAVAVSAPIVMPPPSAHRGHPAQLPPLQRES